MISKESNLIKINTGICGPWGSFANHLRWLILLSKEYNFLNSSTQFISKDSEKIKFIIYNVYDNNRTCFNWLDYEWKYRKVLNRLIYLDHNIHSHINFLKLEEFNRDYRLICLDMEPDTALKHYLKFNPNLSTFPKGTLEFFYENANRDRNFDTNLKNIKKLVLDANLLYNKVLNKQLYNNVVDFLNIENVYNDANYIHEFWFNLQEKAKIDVLTIESDWKYTKNINRDICSNRIELIKKIYSNS